jgi:CheY-like chemotaxis protein
VDALTKLASTLVWPVIVVYALVRFGPKIGDFIVTFSEFNLKGWGFEASAKKGEAAAALAAASASKPEEGATPEAVGQAAREAVKIITELSTRNLRQISGATVLWVDDRPQNNVYERQALGALGLHFVLSTSTDDALDKIHTQKFDAIISDMGRPPDPMAGYTLLDTLRSSGNETPFIIYAGSRAPEHQAEARRRGALGCTNRATELFGMVLSAISR